MERRIRITFVVGGKKATITMRPKSIQAALLFAEEFGAIKFDRHRVDEIRVGLGRRKAERTLSYNLEVDQTVHILGPEGLVTVPKRRRGAAKW